MLARGNTVTGAVNRSLVRTDWLDTEMRSGAQMIIRREDGTELLIPEELW
jgi:hypothetical protein